MIKKRDRTLRKAAPALPEVSLGIPRGWRGVPLEARSGGLATTDSACAAPQTCLASTATNFNPFLDTAGSSAHDETGQPGDLSSFCSAFSCV